MKWITHQSVALMAAFSAGFSAGFAADFTAVFTAAFAFAVLQELPVGGVLRAGEEFAEKAVFGGMRERRQSEGGHGDQRSAGQLHHANLPKKEPDEVIISGEATIEQTFDAFY